MALLKTIEELDLSPPDNYVDLQIWLQRNFEILKFHGIAGEVVLSAYDALPARASVTNLHGGLTEIFTGQILNSGSPIAADNGLGKIYLVPTAGSDAVGQITITGTKVDRATGVQTASFVETLELSQLATDESVNDANGNPVWHLHDGVISTEWFLGSVTIATTDVDLTDVDGYNVSFEQFNDTPFNLIATFDVNFFVTNVAARFDAYVFCVCTANGLTSVTEEGALNLGVPPIANRYYRLRKTNLTIQLDGATDGLFVQAHFSVSPARIEDVTYKIWSNDPTSI